MNHLNSPLPSFLDLTKKLSLQCAMQWLVIWDGHKLTVHKLRLDQKMEMDILLPIKFGHLNIAIQRWLDCMRELGTITNFHILQQEGGPLKAKTWPQSCQQREATIGLTHGIILLAPVTYQLKVRKRSDRFLLEYTRFLLNGLTRPKHNISRKNLQPSHFPLVLQHGCIFTENYSKLSQLKAMNQNMNMPQQ